MSRGIVDEARGANGVALTVPLILFTVNSKPRVQGQEIESAHVRASYYTEELAYTRQLLS